MEIIRGIEKQESGEKNLEEQNNTINWPEAIDSWFGDDSDNDNDDNDDNNAQLGEIVESYKDAIKSSYNILNNISEISNIKPSGICKSFVNGEHCEENFEFLGEKSEKMKPKRKCRNMMQYGKCKFGDSCNFSHDFDNSNNPGNQDRRGNNNSGKKILCKNMIEHGECKFGDSCRYSHNTSGNNKNSPKKTLCRNIIEKGSCKFGDNCRYSHNVPNRSNVKNSGKKIPCKNMIEYGSCKFGDNCRFSHDIPESNIPNISSINDSMNSVNISGKREATSRKICINFANGSCTYGNRCFFSHNQ